LRTLTATNMRRYPASTRRVDLLFHEKRDKRLLGQGAERSHHRPALPLLMPERQLWLGRMAYSGEPCGSSLPGAASITLDGSLPTSPWRRA